MRAAEKGVDICCEATLTPRAALGIQTVLAGAGAGLSRSQKEAW